MKINEDEYENIKNLYKKGDSPYKIAEKYNVSRSCIMKILNKIRVKKRTLSEARRVFDLKEDFFETIDNEEKAYWLGFFYADGWVSVGRESKRSDGTEYRPSLNYKSGISLHEKDIYVLHNLSKILFNGKRTPTKDSSSNNWTIKVNSKKMAEDLQKNGCILHKTYLLAEMPKIEHSLIRHFVRGFFDGDGSVSKRGNGKDDFNHYGKISFVGPIEFLEKIKTLFKEEIGVEFKIISCSNSEIVHKAEVYSNKDVRKVFNYLYDGASIFLTRKFGIFVELFLANKIPFKISVT